MGIIIIKTYLQLIINLLPDRDTNCLILGAGESNPYGYPLGNTFKDNIISDLKEMLYNDSGWLMNLNLIKI